MSDETPRHEESIEPDLIPKRGSPWTRYLFLVGLSFYVVVIWYLGWQDVRDEFLAANALYIAASTGIIFVGSWVRALKWRYALGPGHAALGIFFLSKVAANWSPGRLGEFTPMVIRRHRTPKIGAWIMLDRILEIIVTLVIGLIGLAFIDFLSLYAYLGILALAVMGTILVLYLLTRRDMFLWLAKRLRDDSWPHRFAMLFAAISVEIFVFAKRVPLSLAITVVTKCTDLWAVCLLFQGFGYNPGFALVAAAKCALAIVSFLPITPLATGLPHGTQAWLMNQAADIPYEGLAAVIGVEVVIVSVMLWTSFGLATPFLKEKAPSA